MTSKDEPSLGNAQLKPKRMTTYKVVIKYRTIEAFPSITVKREMSNFLNLINKPKTYDRVINTAISHIWFITIFLLFYLVQSGFSQKSNNVFTYSIFSKKINKNAPGFVKNNVWHSDKGIIEISVYVSPNESVSIYNDAHRLADQHDNSWAQIIADSRAYVCNNLLDSTYLYNTIYEDTLYTIINKYDIGDWEIMNESEIVLNKKCKKAILRSPTKFNDEVIKTIWYTENVNPGIGPLDYVGFPGQVIKVSTDFYDIELSYEQASTDDSKVCNINGELLTKEEFNKMKKRKYLSKITKN